jgi:hypothetical protein
LEVLVSQTDDLVAAVDSLKQLVADTSASVDAEIARVEAVIAALSGSTDPKVAQAIADLQASSSSLSAAKAKLDGERA